MCCSLGACWVPKATGSAEQVVVSHIWTDHRKHVWHAPVSTSRSREFSIVATRYLIPGMCVSASSGRCCHVAVPSLEQLNTKRVSLTTESCLCISLYMEAFFFCAIRILPFLCSRRAQALRTTAVPWGIGLVRCTESQYLTYNTCLLIVTGHAVHVIKCRTRNLYSCTSVQPPQQ